MEGLIYAYCTAPSYPPSSLQRRRKDSAAAEHVEDPRQARQARQAHQPHSNHNNAPGTATAAHRRQSDPVSGSRSSAPLLHEDDSVGMEATRERYDGSISGSSTSGSIREQNDAVGTRRNPFELRHGRRYLRDLPYPLPCDLAETQRQNLRTLLGNTVFGRPVNAPGALQRVPQKVLEVGCGGGYWTATCHEYFSSLGHPDVSFTGLDIAPIAPDYRKQGMKWRFVQHDVRLVPLPFDDGSFDYIMVKDMSLAIPVSEWERQLEECIRICSEGGTIEIWDSDYLLRTLLPPPAGKNQQDEETALATGTYSLLSGTPFAPAQNKYVQDSNSWISEALDKRKLAPIPCSRIAQLLYQEPDTLCDVGTRRIAVPLRELNWEKERAADRKHSRTKSDVNPAPVAKGKGKAGAVESFLTAEQTALRSTALLTVLQMVESLEPLLKEVSGKNTEEWSHWWASMMSSLLDHKGPATGECLEVGAWWATKRTTSG